MRAYLKRLVTIIGLVIVMLLMVPAEGQTQDNNNRISGSVQSLEQAIETALENNPGIQAAHAGWQAALENVPVSGAWPEPSLNLVQFLEPIETRNGPQQQQIGLNQMIPLWGTTGFKRKIAYQKALKARQDYEAAKIQVISRVKSIWADLYWVDASIQTLEEYQEMVQTFQDIAEVRYSTGKGMQTSVLKAQLEITSLEEKTLNFQDMRETMARRLNELLNRSIEATVETSGDLTLPEYTMEEPRLMELLGEYRQDLNGLRAMIEANRSMVSLQSRRNLPSLGVGVNYITIGEPEIAMGATEPAADGLAVMAKIDLPLWFGANRSRVQEAKLNLARTQYQYADRRNTAEADVRAAHFKILQTRKSLELYQDRLIPEAEQTLNSALSAYKTGGISFLDLLDSERMIVQFKLNYFKERASFLKEIASLEKAIGTELTNTGE